MFDALIKCIGISTIDWNHGAFYGHFLGKPHGMMEQWNFGRLDMKSKKRSNLKISFIG